MPDGLQPQACRRRNIPAAAEKDTIDKFISAILAKIGPPPTRAVPSNPLSPELAHWLKSVNAPVSKWIGARLARMKSQLVFSLSAAPTPAGLTVTLMTRRRKVDLKWGFKFLTARFGAAPIILRNLSPRMLDLLRQILRRVRLRSRSPPPAGLRCKNTPSNPRHRPLLLAKIFPRRAPTRPRTPRRSQPGSNSLTGRTKTSLLVESARRHPCFRFPRRGSLIILAHACGPLSCLGPADRRRQLAPRSAAATRRIRHFRPIRQRQPWNCRNPAPSSSLNATTSNPLPSSASKK